MTCAITNRKFQPAGEESIPFAVKGEFPHAASERIQVIDEACLRAIPTSFYEEAAKPGWIGLPVDFDHESYDPSKRSESAGWVVDIRREGDMLAAFTHLTDTGFAAVNSGRYRYASPAWLPKDLESLGGKRVRPLRLDSIGLTNQPNIKALPPITNRSAAVGSHSADTTRGGHRPRMIANRTTPPKLQRFGGRITALDCITDLKRATGLNFDQLWHSSAPFLNRFSNRDGALGGDAMWREVLDREQEAFDKTWNLWDRTGSDIKDRGRQIYRGCYESRSYEP